MLGKLLTSAHHRSPAGKHCACEDQDLKKNVFPAPSADLHHLAEETLKGPIFMFAEQAMKGGFGA